jgi:hypothetical protein
MWFIKSKFVCADETVIEEIESANSMLYSNNNYNRKVDKWYDIILNINNWESSNYYKFPYPNSKECFYINDTELKLKLIETILKHKNEQDDNNRSFVIERYNE